MRIGRKVPTQFANASGQICLFEGYTALESYENQNGVDPNTRLKRFLGVIFVPTSPCVLKIQDRSDRWIKQLTF